MYDAAVGVPWEIFRVFSTTYSIVCSTIYCQLAIGSDYMRLNSHCADEAFRKVIPLFHGFFLIKRIA